MTDTKMPKPPSNSDSRSAGGWLNRNAEFYAENSQQRPSNSDSRSTGGWLNRYAEFYAENSRQRQQRLDKLIALRDQGEAYPNDFRRDSLADDLQQEFKGVAQLDETRRVKVAGRMMSKRGKGKVAFADLQDMSGRIQLFVKQEVVGDDAYRKFDKYDIGDIIGAEGELFRTKAGELSVRVDNLHLLAKSLRSLPEKYHGLTDTESKYRMRYVDLIMSERTREVFKTRAKIVKGLRTYLTQEKFMEVETPMMHPIPGGAAARPFTTHHNELDRDLYLRIAPELYLKRLVVGGFERVFEINRNFRNEGVSANHNPEFTMLEFYQAFADYRDAMRLTERMLRKVCKQTLGTEELTYQDDEIDLSKRFTRMTMLNALCEHNPKVNKKQLTNRESAAQVARAAGVEVHTNDGLGKLQLELFEKTVEDKLIQPTFITAYPVEVSPLSRRNEKAPDIADRFELFIAGREIANGFSELNDPEDQAARFKQQAQAADAGDLEAMHYDSDYIRALEYGMPPTAGVGIGVDRLVMLLTDSASIRDVLLFPQLRRAPR